MRFEPADPLRLEGGIHFILEEARDNGNLYLMENDLLERAYTMLSERVPEDAVTKSMVRKSYSEMCTYGKIHLDHGKSYLPQLFHYEDKTAKKIAQMLKKTRKDYQELERFLQEAQKENGILLSNKQAEAVLMCIKNQFSVIALPIRS